MPLINLNEPQKNNSNVLPPLPEPQKETVANDVTLNQLSEQMKLQSPVTIQNTADGIKEYVPTPQLNNVNPVAPRQDISENLQSQLQQVLPVVSQPEVNTNDLGVSKVSNEVPDLNLKVYTLADLLSESIKLNASDIHLSVGYRAAVRVDGELTNLNSSILTQQDLLEYTRELLKHRPDLDINKNSDLDLGYSFQNRRFRVNIFKQMGTLSIAARIVPERIKTIDELDLPQIFKKFAQIESGLVLVTGPTGSGKSTTLASVLNHINNTQKIHIITLEDPVEFIFPKGISLVDQRELGQDFHDWDKALKSILRQDPDIVLVGEMRDLETISSTITISETGHLVFATLHTNSASQTIDRIIDVFPEAQQAQIRSQLSNVLTAVISQKLIPLNSGGRKAVIEVMVATPAIKNAIREGKTYQIDNMIQTGQDYGMISSEAVLVQMVRGGLISIETARNYSRKPDELDMLLSKS
jgi:twitching motility protein PilT